MNVAFSALCYLQAWEGRLRIPGGLAFEPLLRRIALDHSPASLARIDTFLDALRTAKRPQRDSFIADGPGQNLLYLLAFYVGDVIGRALRCAPEWIPHEESGFAQLQGGAGERTFEGSVRCNFPGAAARIADFAPLVAICARLFTGSGEKSVAFSAGALLPGELQGSKVPLPPAPGFGYPLDLQQALARRDSAPPALDVPPWAREDALAPFFSAAPEVLRTGHVAWGAVVQANTTLFTPEERGGAPGEVVYDPSGRAPAAALDDVAQALLSMRGEKFEDGAMAAVTDYLRDGTTRVFGLDVPGPISLYPLKISTTWFDRAWLPGHVLAYRTFPVVTSPAHPGIVLVLPAALWPPVLLQAWLG